VVTHHIGFIKNIVLENNLTVINKVRFLEQTIQGAATHQPMG
jgi:hypothetical protein